MFRTNDLVELNTVCDNLRTWNYIHHYCHYCAATFNVFLYGIGSFICCCLYICLSLFLGSEVCKCSPFALFLLLCYLCLIFVLEIIIVYLICIFMDFNIPQSPQSDHTWRLTLITHFLNYSCIFPTSLARIIGGILCISWKSTQEYYALSPRKVQYYFWKVYTQSV
jgi:hypothetical protein